MTDLPLRKILRRPLHQRQSRSGRTEAGRRKRRKDPNEENSTLALLMRKWVRNAAIFSIITMLIILSEEYKRTRITREDPMANYRDEEVY
jgi:hypothetical protein